MHGALCLALLACALCIGQCALCIAHWRPVQCIVHCALCIAFGALVHRAWRIALQRTAEQDASGKHREGHHEEHQDEDRVHA